MEEEKNKKTPEAVPEEETSMEKLLREREKLDARLKDKFSQQVTVMFTDIKGSTTFFETYGDIEGRLMVQKHNEMLFPVITDHKGRVIKTIGDAIMAAFEEPAEAVRAAIDMQQSLCEYNRQKKEKKEQIHIRIGINTGEGLVEKNDIYGDVVNVAARVESLTLPDEILVSGPVYDVVRKTDDIICRYANQTKVKGKEEPIEVYRVVWGEEDALAGVTRSAAGAKTAGRKRQELRHRLEIDISREADTLRITASEKSDGGGTTIRPYEEMRISLPSIEERCQEIITLLNRANTRGKVSKDILAKMRDVGQVLFDNLLSAKAKETLRSSSVNDLVFYIEDTLVQIPWELLYDGEQFLCQKFNMGRIVKTKNAVFNIKQRVLSRPLKMLIVSDPRGDLENSFQEGRSIREQMDKNAAFISANQRSGRIPASYIQEKIRNFDIVHYAGHADYDTADPSGSGWLLDGSKFTSADIVKLIGGKPMPALVFSNACQSGQTEEWRLGTTYNQKIFGLANAFLLAGVRHYVGTFWEILDEPGARFAEEFYRAMMDGASIGEAMRLARMFLIKKYGEDTIVWASYMLYGDPGFNYFDIAHEAEDAAEAAASGQQELKEAAQLRSTPGETISFDRASA
ncbi:MAG: CHAT domain-containing protein, partial [Pseudomonadota bacterium]